MDSIQFQNLKMEKPRGISRLFTNLFRLIELFLLLILISKFSVNLSGDIFKETAVFLVSPRFVFFIGNAIVITLFAKSGRYSSSQTTTEAENNDLYQELLHKSEKKRSETKPEQAKKPTAVKRVSFEKSQPQKAFEAVQPLESTNSGKILKKVVIKVNKTEEGMSNEQFRSKIEAFIARQKRIQKDEEHLII